MTIDERFVQLAREIPGFGGYYRDREGNLNVVLTNPAAQGEAARAALAPVLPGGRGRGMIMRQGRYDFAQLHAWRLQVDPAVLGFEGVAFTDVNEVTNRVEIGIWDATVRDGVRQAVSGLPIPPAAIGLVNAEAVEEHASLRDRVRPSTGGLQISRVLSSGNLSLCTLGFNVLVDGKYGYFTNSHCTQSGIGTVHRQDAANDRIGVEVQDPAPYAYGSTQTFNGVSYTCTDTDGCRFSDASRGVYDDSVQAQVKFGYIARTLTENEYQGGDPDSTAYGATMYTIDSGNPYFRIVGKAADVVVGDVIHKVGYRTGWTSGIVDRTCVYSSSTGRWCQLAKGDPPTRLLGNDGDSGSPVFRRVPGSETDVELVGLYWGTYISPIANIERDMGMSFDVAAP
ncbi:MAG TPA: hypothetical protein VHG08_05125 [Longimicrobium sp.]|nr:hypothetical protein [Longimicrobium sp.]